MTIMVSRSLAEEKWRQFVDEHPMGNIFHTPEMFEVFQRAVGHRPELWTATRDGRVLALFLPVQITLKGGVLHFLTTRAVVYGGILCAPGIEGQEALTKLLRVYKHEVEGSPLFTELRNLSDVGTVQPTLQALGFAYENHLNYLIDLECASEDILARMGSRTRKNIRRALRQGEVVIGEISERKQVSVWYELVNQTYQLVQIPLADISLFQAAFDILDPKNMVRFTVAHVDEAVAAVSVELLYKDIIYGWYGGTDRAYGSYIPNDLLTWAILKWGAENSYRVYDFGGAGKPDEVYGPRTFKAKFAGELVCFGRNRHIHFPGLFLLSKQGYRFMYKFLLA